VDILVSEAKIMLAGGDFQYYLFTEESPRISINYSMSLFSKSILNYDLLSTVSTQ
jgi:hypothetical protein